jgi:hypothetical protein
MRLWPEQNKVFAFVGSVGTPQNQAIKAYTAQNKIPNIFIYSGIYEWGDEKQNPWGIGWCRRSPPRPRSTRSTCKSISRCQGRNALSQHRLRQQFPRRLQGRHQDGKITRLAAARSNANTDPTVDTQLTNLKASGADTLIVATAGGNGRAGDPVRGRIRLEADRVPSPMRPHLVISLKAAGLKFKGRAHRPVRQAGRISSFR